MTESPVNPAPSSESQIVLQPAPAAAAAAPAPPPPPPLPAAVEAPAEPAAVVDAIPIGAPVPAVAAVAQWAPETFSHQPQWTTANAATAAQREGDVVAISFSRDEERRMTALERRLAEFKSARRAAAAEAGTDFDGNNRECDSAQAAAAAAAAGGGSAPDEPEDSATVIAALGEADAADLAALRAKYDDFCREGERRLKQGALERQRQLDYESQGGAWGSLLGGVTSAVTTVASAVGTGAKTVGGAGLFWGSLVATALPGYVGRKAGLTVGYEHWNWVSDKLILGALPVLTQVGNSGNHLEKLRAQIEERNTQLGGMAKESETDAPAAQAERVDVPGSRLGLVVACLSEEEMRGYGIPLLEFCSEQHWRRAFGDAIEYVHVPMPDMTADTRLEPVVRAVDRMHDVMHNKKEVVYCHCKAGKGRSWMVVIAYLTTYGGMSFEDAEAVVRAARHQVSPSASQVNFAKHFAERYAKFKARHAEPSAESTAATSTSEAAGPPPAQDY